MTNLVGDVDTIRCFLQQVSWTQLFHCLPCNEAHYDRSYHVFSFPFFLEQVISTYSLSTVISPRLNQISRKATHLFYFSTVFGVVFIAQYPPLLLYRFVVLGCSHLLFQICASYSDRSRKCKYPLPPVSTNVDYLATLTFWKTTSVLKKLSITFISQVLPGGSSIARITAQNNLSLISCCLDMYPAIRYRRSLVNMMLFISLKLPWDVKDGGTFWLKNDVRFLDWIQTALTA